jgi:5-oxoprolinase (ATP-hydrolysing)
MGGTSTDVSHFDGEYERAFETEVAGRSHARAHDADPHGGGGRRLDPAFRRRAASGRPDSAGANPGPRCYRRGGPLAGPTPNVMVGKLDPLSYRASSARTRPSALDDRGGSGPKLPDGSTGPSATGGTPEAGGPNGLIRIAVENMANAIKKISGPARL